jgi:hypothetical protein
VTAVRVAIIIHLVIVWRSENGKRWHFAQFAGCLISRKRSSVGNGKAHLTTAATNTLVARDRPVLFATAPELLVMVQSRFDVKRAGSDRPMSARALAGSGRPEAGATDRALGVPATTIGTLVCLPACPEYAMLLPETDFRNRKLKVTMPPNHPTRQRRAHLDSWVI